MSSRVYLFFPPRGYEPPPTLRDRLNLHLSLQCRRFPPPRYAKRADVALDAIGPLFPHPTSFSLRDSLRQPHAAHSDEERPRPQKFGCAQRCLSARTPVYFEGTVIRDYLIAWSLVLRHDDTKQTPVVYGAEFDVVLLAKDPRTGPLQKASLASALTIWVLGKRATSGWSYRSCRYRLMLIQHARVRLAISTDIFGVPVSAPPS